MEEGIRKNNEFFKMIKKCRRVKFDSRNELRLDLRFDTKFDSRFQQDWI
jgi:hypothetical protein